VYQSIAYHSDVKILRELPNSNSKYCSLYGNGQFYDELKLRWFIASKRMRQLANGKILSGNQDVGDEAIMNVKIAEGCT